MADSRANQPVAAPPSHLSRAENWISVTLRAGVLVSLLLIVAGTLTTFLHHPQYVASKPDLARLTSPGAAFPRTLAEVAAGIVALRGQAIVAAGLLILIATPVLRVAISIFVFVEDRDYPFAVITTTVLVILLVSFLLGRIGGG
jgi:uncharacterized membrane protein